MKLFLTMVLASLLMMKTAEGADGDVGGACLVADLKCKADSNAFCGTDDTCQCNEDYAVSTVDNTVCRKKSGEVCEAVDECAVNACTNKKCGMATGADCKVNTDCVTFNCKYMDGGSEKCADAGAAGVVASVLLMVATLMTSRIL